MDASRILWFTLELLLVTSAAYGHTQTNTVEEYIDEIFNHVYSKVEQMIPENKSVTLKNVTIYLDNSSVPTTFGIFSLGRFSGLGTRFNRTRLCTVRERDSEYRVNCKVGFVGLQATLPKGTEVLLINASGHLIISVPKDDRNAKVWLMTLSEVKFTMQVSGSNNGALSSAGPTYISDEEISTYYKSYYRLVFQKFITEGRFKNALDAALSSVAKVELTILQKRAEERRQGGTKVQKKKFHIGQRIGYNAKF